MANERYSESLVLKEMGADLGENDFGFVFPQGEAVNFDKIEKCLKEMGGKPAFCSLEDYDTVGPGKAKPEYIVTFNKDKNTIILVECKKSIKEHESSEKNMPQKYAVDGALFYAKHLKDDYNVVAVAVSGTSKENVKVNTFYWKKGFEDYQELKKAKDTILDPLNYLNLVEGKKLERKFSLQEIRELSQIMHKKLRQIKISEKDKPIFIAGMLIALQNTDFRNTWNNINSFNSLVKLMIDSIEETLDNSDIKREKIEAIKSSFRRIKSNEKIKSIPLGENGSLAWFIEQLEMRILPMMNHYEYTEDALSIFYHEFIKYSSTDGKGLGIVLTPKHLTDFMCKLGEINKQSKVVDICCGSASFLVTAMGLMCKEANSTEILEIKKNGLYGVELDTDLYTLAITNMIIRKDGKSNIVCGDCFSQEIYNNLKNKHLSLGLINPPYSQEDKCELEFVERLLNVLEPRGLAVAVVPMSCAIGTKFKEVRDRLFKYHTLKAVFSMPDDIFYPTGTNVCVMVWEAHKSHDSTKPTFFGYCKDDGFVKRKKMGRIDYYNKWDDIEKEWLDLYENKKVVDGKSALQCVTYENEWLCEAYMKTDYSTLTQSDFQKTINNYLSYMVKNGLSSLNINFVQKNITYNLNTDSWKEYLVSDYFTVTGTKTTKVDDLESYGLGNFPYVTTQAINNGVENFYNHFTEKGNVLTIDSAVLGYCTYQENPFSASDHVEKLTPKFKLNKYIALFFVTLFNNECYKYSYGRKSNQIKIRNTILKLPTKNNEPDWEFMEDYIKSLPYADRI